MSLWALAIGVAALAAILSSLYFAMYRHWNTEDHS